MPDRLPTRFGGRDTITTRFEPMPTQPGYTEALNDALAEAISGEVRFDRGTRGAYSTDSSNYRQAPIGVVVPRTIDDVVRTVAICRRFGAPITSRGGGTSLAGQACNAAVVIDYSKYLNRVIEVDPDRRRAVVEPGCNLDDLRRAAGRHGLTFGPDPSTHDRNTLGGMLGNNSCGVHSVMSQFYGPGPTTAHQVVELEILTYDGERMTVGATDEVRLEEFIEEGGRQGEIYERLSRLRDEYGDLIRTRYPGIPRRVSGYNLNWLLPENGFQLARALVGSEGTCVVILSATVELIESQPARTLVVLGYPDIYQAGDHIPEILEHRPVGLEGMDSKLVGYMKKKGLHPEDVHLLPEGEGWLLVEFGGDDKSDSDARAKEFVEALRSRDDTPAIKEFTDPWEEQKLWEVRESGLGATANVPGMGRTHPGWEDAAVPPDQVGSYLRRFRQLLDDFDYEAALYGHFGQGCIHCRIDFDFSTPHGVDRFTRFLEEAADLVVEHGGSLSGEHGDGQARAALLDRMFGSELVEAFGRFKSIWDPDDHMNPGKVVHAHRPDEDLRLGPDYAPVEIRTHFRFPDDEGSFAKAMDRCVGVGKCRDVSGGVMCPSYMATREEEDSTRGRARMLFEMLRGDIIADGWRDDHVAEALDLCLACKACKNECPVNVDMATYKAEFLSHYYKRRLRPPEAYAMGLIYWSARLASHFPGLANWLAGTRPFSTIGKWLAGVADEREIPRFAFPTFRSWFERRPATVPTRRPGAGEAVGTPKHEDVPRFQGQTFRHGSDRDSHSSSLRPHGDDSPLEVDTVVLWPDTFNNYLTTGPARAAVTVLEDAGYQVEIPPRPLCCGRPLYDWGMLDTAEHLWRQTLDTLRPFLRRGVPVIGIEPSCVAAFRDELINLFPNDADAVRLSESTYELSEFLVRQGYQPPPLNRSAIVQGHCHHKAIMHMDAEAAVFDAMGLDYEILDSGCCGMAGAFGFAADHYDVSVRVGERVLLPRVREADDSTLIVANGFSCREQITQTTERRALHLAEVITLALRHGPGGPSDGTPESNVEEPSQPDRPSTAALLGAGTAAAALLGAVALGRKLR